MMRYFLCLLLLLSFPRLSAQMTEPSKDKQKFLGLDFYGSALPVVFDPIQFTTNLHIGLNFKFLGNNGFTYSNWAYGNSYNYDRFSGFGVKVGPHFDHLILKFEGGLLIHYSKIEESYGFIKKRGARLPYFRLHWGYRLKKAFCWGLNMNWIPKNGQLAFSHRNNYISTDVISKDSRKTMHLSPSFYFGFIFR
ncbi:MAG: hypothetical protein AAF696_07545 [Bacteroidota bacterium]